jgi:hypothetical protein
MAKQIYTDGETAKYRAKRREAFKNEKREFNRRGKLIQLVYPDNATQQQRGFTPAGSAKLNFDAIKRMSVKKERLGIESINRKPTSGSKRIFQLIGKKVIHHTRPLRNQVPLFN